MSGMLAVSKPPTIITDGLRRSHASVTGRKVCHEANQPKTRSLPQHPAHDQADRVRHAAGLVQSRSSWRSARKSRSICTKLALREWT